jgi:hypothetical protein
MMRLIMEVPALDEAINWCLKQAKVGDDRPSGRVKALDELLDLPHLDVLFRYVLAHPGRRWVLRSRVRWG